jgi:probable F420-dependent oxidoreductase
MREMVLAIHAIWNAWETGEKLDFRGEFYKHTLMTPAFDPGPNPFGPPSIFLAGVQPKMIEVAGEVADGFLAHPFASRRSLAEHILPSLARGLAKSGRRREDLELVSVALLVTGNDDEELAANKEVVRKQLAFYGSTPAYKPTLDCHGWGDLQPELNALSKQGRWDAMSELVSDEMLEQVAVVAPRDQAAAAVLSRFEGLSDAVSIENPRAPDPSNFADIVGALKRAK